MNKINGETRLLVITVMIAAVAGLAAQSLTTTQTAEAGGGCSERPDGTLYCSGGRGNDDGVGGDGPGGRGGHNTLDPETGDAVQSGGGSPDTGQPSQDNHKEGSGGRCVYNINEEGADCVGKGFSGAGN
jgi:hypothetical protein